MTMGGSGDQIGGKSVSVHDHDGASAINAIEIAHWYKDIDTPHGYVIQGRAALCRLASAAVASFAVQLPDKLPDNDTFRVRIARSKKREKPAIAITTRVSNWWR